MLINDLSDSNSIEIVTRKYLGVSNSIDAVSERGSASPE